MLAAATTAWGQEEPEKAAPAKAGAAKAAAKAAPPAESAPPQDPAVQAILESKPSTPAEFVRGAKILFDLQRPDLAKTLLQKVLDANPSDAQLADLARQFSLKMFLDFATVPELNPPARATGRRGLDRQRQGAPRPEAAGRIDPEASRPGGRGPRGSNRRTAAGRTAGIEALVAVLADPGRQAEHDVAAAALVQLGSDAAGPMLGILTGAGPEMKVLALKVLAALRVPETADFILAPYAAPRRRRAFAPRRKRPSCGCSATRPAQRRRRGRSSNGPMPISEGG